ATADCSAGIEPLATMLPVVSITNMTSISPRAAWARPPSWLVTLLTPANRQNDVACVRVTLMSMFSTIGVAGVGTPATGVDVGKVMLMLVPGVAVPTPLANK